MANNQVALALAAIAAANGGKITPDQVVAAAQDPASPLHECFEWDDEKAAVEHRRDQARALIRSVEVKVQIGDVVLKAPAYIRDPEAEKAQGYATVTRLRSNEDIAREAVVAEFSRATSALSRAKAIAAVLGFDGEIAELHQRVTAMAAKITDQPTAPAQ